MYVFWFLFSLKEIGIWALFELDAGEGDGMISFPVAPVRPGPFRVRPTSLLHLTKE